MSILLVSSFNKYCRGIYCVKLVRTLFVILGLLMLHGLITSSSSSQLNASDDRGIGIVRREVLSFASTRTIFRSGFKLVILDEADAMTNDAQNALRRG